MTLSENQTYLQVLGSLIHNPLLMAEINNDIKMADFDTRITRVIFLSIANLIKSGVESLSPLEVISYIESIDTLNAEYKSNNGEAWLQLAVEVASPENFQYYYKRLKKLSLLRRLLKENYDISLYYKEIFDTAKEEREANERFDEATVENILDTVEGKIVQIRNEYLNSTAESKTAASGIEELIDQFKQTPEFGVDMPGSIFNIAARGARLGKFYLRSGSTSAGKSRSAVFDACAIAFPERWHFEKKCFVRYERPAYKTLIITTEMDASEIQTIILAAVSGVNEEKILYGNYIEDEELRVRKAASIMKKYENYLFIEEITNPNLTNVEATIKKQVLINEVKYVFYDYIFTSPSLVEQFGSAKLREDTALSLLANQLKELAKVHNIFVMTSSQVNSDGMRWDTPKNETCLRGQFWALIYLFQLSLGCA